MSNTDRKLVRVEINSFDPNYQTIDGAIEELENIRKTYGGDCKIYKTTYDYSDSQYYSIYTSRLENDDEYNKRIENEKRQHQLQEQRDAAEFARLSAKYPKK